MNFNLNSKNHSIFLLQVDKLRKIKEAEKTLRKTLSEIQDKYEDDMEKLEEHYSSTE